MNNTTVSWIINDDNEDNNQKDPLMYWHLKDEDDLNNKYRSRYKEEHQNHTIGKNHKIGNKVHKPKKNS